MLVDILVNDYYYYWLLFLCSLIVNVDSADSECDSGQEEGDVKRLVLSTHFFIIALSISCITCSEDSSDDNFETAFEKPTCVKR